MKGQARSRRRFLFGAAGVAAASTSIGQDAATQSKFPDSTELGKVINVHDPAYGARGDNVTDDTAAINAAITAASAGGVVELEAVTYKTTGPLLLYSGVILRGKSKLTTIIKPVGASFNGIHCDSKTDIALHDFTVDMSAVKGTADGIFLRATHRSEVARVVTNNAARAGVRFDGNAYGNAIRGVTGTGNLYGLDVAGNSSKDAVTTLHCDSCWWAQNTLHGVRLANAALMSFTNCTSELNQGSGVKLEKYTSHINWRGGTIEANSRYAMETDATHDHIVIDGYHDAAGGLGLYSAALRLHRK